VSGRCNAPHCRCIDPCEGEPEPEVRRCAECGWREPEPGEEECSVCLRERAMLDDPDNYP
jgi:hypothetical protein